ncbi:MAG TPA: hypothetical protein PKD72_03455 [Gemmatales bacterium]|nr:hypothetical protein [Gemmatales bacterium]
MYQLPMYQLSMCRLAGILFVVALSVGLPETARGLTVPARGWLVGTWSMQAQAPEYSFSHRWEFQRNGTLITEDTIILNGKKTTQVSRGQYRLASGYLTIVTGERYQQITETARYRVDHGKLELEKDGEIIVFQRVK